MKKRNGFVSNSSSSSFVVYKDKLSDKQISIILDPWVNENLIRDIYDLCWEDEDDPTYDEWIGDELSYYKDGCGWSVYDTGPTIELSTSMDNFCYEELFEKIGIPNDAYTGGQN